MHHLDSPSMSCTAMQSLVAILQQVLIPGHPLIYLVVFILLTKYVMWHQQEQTYLELHLQSFSLGMETTPQHKFYEQIESKINSQIIKT